MSEESPNSSSSIRLFPTPNDTVLLPGSTPVSWVTTAPARRRSTSAVSPRTASPRASAGPATADYGRAPSANVRTPPVPLHYTHIPRSQTRISWWKYISLRPQLGYAHRACWIFESRKLYIISLFCPPLNRLVREDPVTSIPFP